jgi:hypothetical protein
MLSLEAASVREANMEENGEQRPVVTKQSSMRAMPILLSANAGYVDTAGYLALQGLFTAHSPEISSPSALRSCRRWRSRTPCSGVTSAASHRLLS